MTIGRKENVLTRRKTDLDEAVEKLRRTHAIVCTEETISRPHKTPPQYRPDTLFRVGDHRNVTGRDVMEMAGL